MVIVCCACALLLADFFSLLFPLQFFECDGLRKLLALPLPESISQESQAVLSVGRILSHLVESDEFLRVRMKKTLTEVRSMCLVGTFDLFVLFEPCCRASFLSQQLPLRAEGSGGRLSWSTFVKIFSPLMLRNPSVFVECMKEVCIVKEGNYLCLKGLCMIRLSCLGILTVASVRLFLFMCVCFLPGSDEIEVEGSEVSLGESSSSSSGMNVAETAAKGSHREAEVPGAMGESVIDYSRLLLISELVVKHARDRFFDDMAFLTALETFLKNSWVFLLRTFVVGVSPVVALPAGDQSCCFPSVPTLPLESLLNYWNQCWVCRLGGRGESERCKWTQYSKSAILLP